MNTSHTAASFAPAAPQAPQGEPAAVCPCGGPLDRLGYCVRSVEATARLTDRRSADPWARGQLEGASVAREART